MFDETPLLMVEDDEALVALAERLSKSRVIGVDTESDSTYHYQEKVCLIQFSDLEGDIIVDTLAVSDMSPLKPIFEDPDIVKIFHGSDYDVVCLRRDFDYNTANLFDTLIAAQFLGMDRLGLADLIGYFFGVPLDKQYQRHDWSSRPLYTEHLDYARGDTHWILALREILLHRLRKAGLVEHQEEECALACKRAWAGRGFDENGYLSIKKSSHIDDVGKRILKRLYLYRDGQARQLDRPPYKVLGDRILIELAEKKPTDRAALDHIFPRQSAMKRRHASALLEAIRDGLEDDFPIPKPTAKKAPAAPAAYPLRLTGRAAERVTLALKDWRNDLINNSTRTAFAVASNATLKAIAQHRPLTLEELAMVPDVRAWQVADLGDEILAVLDEHAPEGSLAAGKKSSGGGRRRRGSRG